MDNLHYALQQGQNENTSHTIRATAKNECTTTEPLATIMWASTQENLSSVVCEQQMRRPACAATQSDQLLCNSLTDKYICRLAVSEISTF